MASLSSATIAYTPGVVPSDAKQLPGYLDDELRKVANTIMMLAAGHYSVTYNAPVREREGNIRLAAGTLEGAHWDPDGSGDRKLYQYRQTSTDPAPLTFDWIPIG